MVDIIYPQQALRYRNGKLIVNVTIKPLREKARVIAAEAPADAPQRIATDTSQKLAIRFGETIKAYEARGLDKSNLILIPLVLAGYARYLKGIDDNGQAFEPSTDPLLAELQAIVAPLEVKEGEQDFSCLKKLYSRVDVFGVDLYAVGLGEKIEAMAKELFAGPGAVRKTLHKYTLAR